MGNGGIAPWVLGDSSTECGWKCKSLTGTFIKVPKRNVII